VGGSLKGRLLTGVALVALAVAGAAQAADMPVKAPPPVAAPWSWAGFYVGAHAGYGWGQNHFTITDDPFFFGKSPGFSSGGYDLKGPLGGFHAGANWQHGRVVGGLEIDLTWTDIRGTSTSNWGPNFIPGPFARNEFGSATHSGKFSLLGTARARLGYALRPDVLLYGTGGLAWTRFVDNTDLFSGRAFVAPPATDAMFLNSSTPSWRFGWVAGLGGEVRLWDSNWIGRIEYLHYDFGNSGSNIQSDPALPALPPIVRTSGNLTLDVVRAGLSYKFYPFVVASAPSAAGAPITKAPVRIPWTWSGYYLGAHAGYGWGRDPFNTILPANGVPLSGLDSDGFVAGFQAGANWQDGSVVGGLEIDISGAGIKGSTSNAVGAAARTQSDKFDRLGSARARLGYLATPNLMLYGTGGLGWTRLVTDEVIVGPLARTTETPNWLFGWVAGVGLETRLWESNWLARVEYLHYDFGDGASVTRVNVGVPSRFPDVTTTSGRLTVDVVRAALSYKLDWPGAAGVGRAVPAKAPAAWTWSGFYIGGHAGYGWGRDPFEELVTSFQILNFVNPAVVLRGPKLDGFVGGFQAGANWQTGAFVGGLEIDLSKTGIKGSSSTAGLDVNNVPVSGTQTDKFDLLGSVRARLGYLWRPDVLVYGTGGLAWTRFEQEATRVAPFWWGTTTASTPSWRFGWVAGIGGQARLWNSNWIARAEYLHYDFGDSGKAVRGFLADGALNSFEASVLSSGNLSVDVVRVGLDYKLN
jgi:opacity protein-like surface antigen